MVTELDRPGRCPTRAIIDDLTSRQVKLNLGGSLHDPTEPVDRLLFNVLAMVAEFSVISTRRYGDLHRGRAAA